MSAHHLLLIEDDPAEAKLAIRTLQKIAADVQITHLSSGVEFLDYLQDDLPGSIDLALMDLHMPGMGGIDFLEKVRLQNLRLPFPLVVFSSSQSSEEIRKAYELGISAFVTKPVEPAHYRQSLKDIIAFWLRTNRLS